MKKEKSKVLKLKRKYNRLNCLRHYGYIPMGILSILGITICGLGTFSLVPIWLSMTGLTMFGIGLTAMYLDSFLCKKIDIKRDKLDERIEKLIDEDAKEKEIFNEYQQVKRLERETKKQVKDKKRLIKSLIEKKNKQAKEYKKLVKILAESKKLDAKKKKLEKLEKDIEQNQNDEYVAHLLERGKETNQVRLADPIIPDEMKITR